MDIGAEGSSLAHDDVDDTRGYAPPRAVAGAGRLGVYAALGAAAGAVPLPWVPRALAHRVRGAMVDDVAARHGLSLSAEARAVLSEPDGPNGPGGWMGQAARFVGAKLVQRTLSGIGPVGLLWPLRGALDTYVLGRLFDRYLERVRPRVTLRIDAIEARRVRLASDGALALALTTAARLQGGSPSTAPPRADDARDAVTAFVDGWLHLAASVPDRVLDRLDAAFDDAIAHGRR